MSTAQTSSGLGLLSHLPELPIISQCQELLEPVAEPRVERDSFLPLAKKVWGMFTLKHLVGPITSVAG